MSSMTVQNESGIIKLWVNLFHWQDVSMHGDEQWWRDQTSEGHAESRSAGLSIYSYQKYLFTIFSPLAVLAAVNIWPVPLEFTESHTWPLDGNIFLFNAGILGWTHGKEALVRWQRWLYCHYTGLTFHHRPFVCLGESQMDAVPQPLAIIVYILLQEKCLGTNSILVDYAL